MSRAPFSKRAPSRSAKEEFYWRGGDSLREKEYLKDEYKKAMADYRKAQMEYQKVEQELQKTNEQLKERESYTNALSSYLDNDTEGSTQEQEYMLYMDYFIVHNFSFLYFFIHNNFCVK